MVRYEKYKDSGIAWIGEVPEHWGVRRIKSFCIVKRGASPRPIDDEKYFDDNGEFAWVRIADASASERYLLNTPQKLSTLGASLSVKRFPDDIFLSIAGTVGKAIITKIKCCIHDGFVWFKNLNYNSELLYYIFESGQPYLGLGKMGTQLNLNTDTVGCIFVPYMNQAEQEQIAKYLDWKCGEVDRIVEVRERQIKLLGELRTSVISRAVTRGLNPNAPLKDSDIDWIGQIPKHWETIKLKYIFTFGKGLNITKEDLVESGMPVISYGQIHSKENHGTGVKESLKRFVNGDYLKTSRQSLVNNNDFIFADTSEDLEGVGNCVFVDNNEMLFAGYHTITLKVKNMQHNKYLAYLFLSDLWRTQIRSRVAGVKVFSITKTILNFNTVLLPPIAEQRQIADYLDKKTAEIDNTINKFKVQIDKLKEYRQALITEVVTGKIDVRGIEIPTPKSN